MKNHFFMFLSLFLVFFSLVMQTGATEGTITEGCTFQSGIDCTYNAKICSDTKEITIPLRNSIGWDILIVDIATDGCSVLGKEFPNTASNGESFYIKFRCSDIKEGKFEMNVKLKYKNPTSGLSQVAVGKVSQKASACAMGHVECVDSDGGPNTAVFGTTKGRQFAYDDTIISKTDYCVAITGSAQELESCKGSNCGVYEFSCVSSGGDQNQFVNGNIIPCLGGCEKGKCVLLALDYLTVAVDDSSPVSDVVLLGDIISMIEKKGYGDVLPESSTLFSKIDTSYLDNKITVAVYNKEILIIVGSRSPTDQVTFASSLKSMLIEELKISPKFILSDEVKVSKLRELFNKLCVDSDGGKDYYIAGIARYPGGEKNSDVCIKKNEDGSWGETASEAPYLVEYYCPTDSDSGSVNFGKEYYLCPGGCRDGACVTETVEEEVKCIFENSESLQKCASDKGSCEGEKSCFVKIKGSKGEKLVWKSTCGGYVYTNIDGDNEIASFSCTQASPDPSCITHGGSTLTNPDGTGFIGCDIEVRGEFDISRSYCIGVSTKKREPLVPDGYGRPNRYYATLAGINLDEEVRVYISSKEGKLIECSPSLNSEQKRYRYAQWSCLDGQKFSEGTPETCNEIAEWKKIAESECAECQNRAVNCGINGFIEYKMPCESGVSCSPVCKNIGTKSEGWYDSCTGELVRYDFCSQKTKDCNGCVAGEKCIPFGTRISLEGKNYYCDITNIISEQKPDESSCQNNYECVSNSCSSGKCIDFAAEMKETKNLIGKLLDWLGNIFGKQKP